MKGKIIDDVYFAFYTYSGSKYWGISKWHKINETISRIEKLSTMTRRRPYVRGDILSILISSVLPFRLEPERWSMHTRIRGSSLTTELTKVRAIASIDKLIKLAKIPSNAT